jgi:hypothetical protein
MRDRWVHAWGLALLLCSAPPLGADSVQVRDDATITPGSSARRRGDNQTIQVGRFDADDDKAVGAADAHPHDQPRTRLGLIRFDLANVPHSVTLVQATLWLWAGRVRHGGSLDIAPILDAWDERTVSGANAPLLGPVAASLGVHDRDEREFLATDVTPLVQEWLDHPESEHGLALVPAAASSLRVEFDSKENTLTSHPAALELTLATGGTGPPGPPGPPGLPLASLDSLAGIPCNLSGSPGFVQVRYLPDGTAALKCTASQGCIDADGDGFFAQSGCGTPLDCNDANAAIHPGATEVCDGVDNNCNGVVDEGCSASCTDADFDGFFAQPGCGTAVDCNDTNPAAHPAAAEVCGDQLDNNCNGFIDESCPGPGIYVATNVGNDNTGLGTMSSPFKTIAKGVSTAAALGGAQAVHVAQGEYSEKVTLVEGISLLGGYRCCDWARSRDVYTTQILNPDFEGVLVPESITRNTRLEGFFVRGKDGAPPAAPGSVAITVKGGTPILEANRIFGGSVSGGSSPQSVGIAILGPPNNVQGALIAGNEVTGGGSSTGVTAALLLSAVAFPPVAPTGGVIVNNTLRGGSGATSYGIAAWTAGPGTLLKGNDISAGSSNAASGAAWGIVVGSTMTIDANRINVSGASGGCSGSSWCGGILSASGTAVITNNIVFGVNAARSAAVLLAEVEKPAGPVVLNANYLDGGGEDASISTAVALQGTLGLNIVIGKIRNNILAGGLGLSRYGVYEDMIMTRTSHPQALDNNDFHFATAPGRTDVLYHFWNGTTATDITTIVGLAQLPVNPAPSGNFAGAPMLDATFHLMAGSPCIDAGTSIEAPATDFEGDQRPQGPAIDVGPDEKR